MRSPATPKGRNVKSAQTTDGHERAKDFLSATEVAKLLDAMKQGPARHPGRRSASAAMRSISTTLHNEVSDIDVLIAAIQPHSKRLQRVGAPLSTLSPAVSA